MLLASLVKADASTTIVDAVHATGLPSRLLQDLATTPPVTLLQVWVTQPADLVRHGSRVIIYISTSPAGSRTSFMTRLSMP